ncbi:MAG: hypothetical protein JNJ59_25660 [Deltaproteobacteria bacterium]|nr:hypothetical protein [Deltaproteobacteria bacterium]
MRLLPFVSFLVLAAPACLDTNEGQVGDVNSPQNANDADTSTAPDTTAADTAVAPDTRVADTAVAPDTTADTTDTTEPDPQCLALDAECYDHGVCCSGTCSWTGAYVAGNCIAPRAVGEACYDDKFCASGFCDLSQGLCVNAQCLAIGSDCTINPGWCCAGSFCQWSTTYAPSLCAKPLESGATCFGASWCASGECTADGICK